MPDPPQGEVRASPAMGRSLRLYVGAVITASLGALAVFSPGLDGLARPDAWIWLLICLGAEFLWLETISGEGTDSMASTVNFAVIFLFAPSFALWIVGLSVLAATRFIQKRNLLKSAFGFSQMVLTTLAASWAFRLAGGGSWEISFLRNPQSLIPCVAAGVTYSLVNTGLVSVAVALEKGLPLVETWRTNYGYRNSLLSALALFIMSPLLLIAYLAVGYWGVFLFFLPLLIVKNQNQEYIELQRTTQALIGSERMAAKGEMAAEIAHELGNYLAILSGRAQLLQGRAMKTADAAMAKDTQIIRDQVSNMTVLTKGLLDFSHKEVKLHDADLNELARKTVEFIRPQNRFDTVDLQVELDPRVGSLSVDAGQIQQVLINLIKNAADAILNDGRTDGIIHVATAAEPGGGIHVVVEDNGPGIPESSRHRVFEPAYTTKADGHGFGLSTCYRILGNHGGKIWVDESPLGGARFHMLLPASKKAA